MTEPSSPNREHHAMTRSAIREATIAAAAQGYLIPINPEEVQRWIKPDCPTCNPTHQQATRKDH